MRRLRPTLLFAALALLLTACSSRPDGVMRQGKMEDVLYDYHIARAVELNEGKPDSERDVTYEEAVFKKHGITAAQFYASLEYYQRHADKLAKIYANLDERFSGERTAKANAADNAAEAEGAENIWPGPRFFVLSPAAANRYTFDIAAPKELKARDRFEWQFDLQWIYSEGRKNGTAVLLLHYPGDSVVTFQQPLYGTGRQTLSANVGNGKVPDRISGFIYQECPWDKKSHLLVVSNVRLLLRHAKANTPPVAHPDSILNERPSRPSRRDSMPAIEGDTLPLPQPLPDKGPRLTRQEGERRILDSIRRNERGKRPHFQ